MVGRAVAGLGQDISQVGGLIAKRAQEMQDADDKNYITKQTNLFENEIRDFTEQEMSLSGEQALKGSERLQKKLDERVKEYVKNAPPHLQSVLTGKLEIRSNDRLNQIAAHEAGQRRVYETQLADQTVETYRQNAYTNPENLPTYLGHAKNELGQRYTDETRSNIVAAAVDGMILRDPALAKEYFGDVQDAMTVAHKKYYENAIDKALRAKAKDAELAAKKVKSDLKEQEKAWAEEDINKAGQLFRDKQLTYEFVDKMRVKDRTKWYERAEKQVKEVEKKGASDAEAGMRHRINTKPDSIESSEEIWALLDSGVSSKVVQSLVSDWEKKKVGDTPAQDARQSRIHSSLARAREAGLFEQEADEDESWFVTEETWRDLTRKTDAFFKENPQATDRDVGGFEDALLKRYREQAAKGLFDKIFDWIKNWKTPIEQPEIVQPAQPQATPGKVEGAGAVVKPEQKKQVRRTGKEKGTGRKIVEYTDGTREYAD